MNFNDSVIDQPIFYFGAEKFAETLGDGNDVTLVGYVAPPPQPGRPYALAVDWAGHETVEDQIVNAQGRSHCDQPFDVPFRMGADGFIRDHCAERMRQDEFGARKNGGRHAVLNLGAHQRFRHVAVNLFQIENQGVLRDSRECLRQA